MSGTPVVIVALGDSLTYGWMVEKGYLDFLGEMIADRFPDAVFSLINCGMPAGTALGGLNRLQKDVLSRNPDCVFVQFGINDAFSGYTPEAFRNNIELIIKRIMGSTDSEIILVTSVCLGNREDNMLLERYYEKLEELAGLYELPLAQVHTYWKTRISQGLRFDDLVQSDHVHPLSNGYRLMAEEIMKPLK